MTPLRRRDAFAALRNATDAELLECVLGPSHWEQSLAAGGLRGLLDYWHAACPNDSRGALAELARRYSAAPWLPGVKLDDAGQVFRHFRRLAELPVEEFWVAFTDSRRRKVGEVRLSSGTADETVWHARDFVRALATHNASGFVIVHNHPSGDPFPSPADNHETRRLTQLARLLNVDFLDHVIIGRASFYSYRDTEGLP